MPILLGPRPTNAALGPVVIEITDGGYNPLSLTIPPDTTVTWMNRGTSAHTVTSDSDSRLDSPSLEPRFAYSYTFHNEGTFPYHDELHAGLTGTVVVVKGAEIPSAPAPTPAPTPSPAPPSGAIVATDDSKSSAAQPVLSSGGADGAGTPQSAAASDGAVAIDAGNKWFGDASFQGGVYETSVHVGDTIQWTVISGVHNVYECGDSWSGVSSSCSSAIWNSDQILTQGGTYSRTFDTAGTFSYLCTIHPQTMRGKVVVEGSGSAPTPTPEPDPSTSPTPTPAAGAGSTSGATPTPTAGAASTSGATPTPAAGAGSTSGATPTPASTANSSTGSATSKADPVVAGESALPKGGGPPPSGDGPPTTPLFAAAAMAFAVSGLIFWRWRRVSAEQ
ncbi:MAG: plastocyanin/azurin family copper-binding protein [Dehalococcoidia bacterium]